MWVAVPSSSSALTAAVPWAPLPQIFGEPAVIDPVEECALLRCSDADAALAAAPTAPAKLHFITTGNSPDDAQWTPGAGPLQGST